jgi:hypothetical protein
VTGFRGVTGGQALRGRIFIEALVQGSAITRVVFQLDGPRSATHTEYERPYFFQGNTAAGPRGWDTTTYPDGEYTLTATAFDSAGRRGARPVRFRVANGG